MFQINEIKDNESFLDWLRKNASLYKSLVDKGRKDHPDSTTAINLYVGKYQAFTAAIEAYNTSQERLREIPEWAKD